MNDLTKISEIELHHIFVEALHKEDYLVCAAIRDEYKKRFDNHTFCEYAFLIMIDCGYPMYGMLDFADNYYRSLQYIECV